MRKPHTRSLSFAQTSDVRDDAVRGPSLVTRQAKAVRGAFPARFHARRVASEVGFGQAKQASD